MDQIQEDILCELGLSKNESKAYLALLDLGEATAGEVSDQAKLHRPNAYDSLERLKLKGLVSFYLKDKTKMFRPAKPENLKGLLKEKERLLDSVLPQLELGRELTTKKAFAETYEGLKALRSTFFSLLDYNEPIFIFGVPAYASETVKSFINQFHNERIEKKILMKHIYNQDAGERIDYLNQMDFTEAAYLPEKFSTNVSTLVCGEDVLLINWDPVVFVRIKNKLIAQAYEKYCDLMLESAKM